MLFLGKLLSVLTETACRQLTPQTGQKPSGNPSTSRVDSAPPGTSRLEPALALGTWIGW
jgi:hypothetical protein